MGGIRAQRANFPFCGHGREKDGEGGEHTRSSELRQSDFIEPRTKVHRIDERYAWVPKRRGFTEDPKEEFLGDQRFRVREASHPCYYAPRGRDSSYLGLFSTFGLRKRGFSF